MERALSQLAANANLLKTATLIRHGSKYVQIFFQIAPGKLNETHVTEIIEQFARALSPPKDTLDFNGSE